MAFLLQKPVDAEFFALLYKDTVRYDHRQHRWLVFGTDQWRPQASGDAVYYAIEAIRQRQNLARGTDRWKWCAGGESHSRLRHQLEIAKSLQPIADPGDFWDTDPWLLGVQNGIVDLRTGLLRRGQVADRITMRTPVAYDIAAVCPRWDAFLASLFDDEEMRRYLQRAIGYSLTGDCREECLFLCWGNGANGKGTFMNTLAYAFGDYADDLPFSTLERNGQSSGIPNDLAKLVGKRYITASESGEATRLNEARIKALTGRDPITARFMRAEYFTFQPAGKFWLATNQKPIIHDDSAGFWRRLHLIPFTQSFVGREDRTLKDDLRAEAAAILAWAIRGCLAWQREGLNRPEAVSHATDEYRRESDPLTPFYDACCMIDPNARVQTQPLYDCYAIWHAGTRAQSACMTLKTFSKQIQTRFRAETKRHTTYIGIGIRERIAASFNPSDATDDPGMSDAGFEAARDEPSDRSQLVGRRGLPRLVSSGGQ